MTHHAQHIALIGATGFIGSALLQEALQRGHRVTALVTRPERLPAHPQLHAVQADVAGGNPVALADQLHGHDAVLSAFSGHAQGDVRGYYLQGVRHIIQAVRAARVPRLLMVGGAGSLEVAPGHQVVDPPDFPDQWRASAEGARDALALLRAEVGLDWTMLSPAALIQPGERTGTFRLGTDQLIVDAQGNSRISVQDYAVAMLNELEQPAHRGRRFTVGY